MDLIGQIKNAFRGVERRLTVVDRRRPAAGKPPVLPTGIRFDRQKTPAVFGKLGTLLDRHKP